MSISERGCARGALLVCLLLVVTSIAGLAQEPSPRLELYGGYSYGIPNARLGPGVLLNNQPRGFEGTATYFFNRWFGLTGSGAANLGDKGNVATALFGPTLKAHRDTLSPFMHFLVGVHHVNPGNGNPLNSDTGIGLALGGGLDVYAGRHLDIRLIQADYIYARHSYPIALASRDWEGARLGAGLVWKLGYGPPATLPSATCSAQPTEVFAGDPVTVTANAQNFPPNRTLSYGWTASGGAKVGGTTQSAQVDTTGLAPGSYTVTSNITSNKKNEVATCNASFTVKERPKNPPTITCKAVPETVKPGEQSTITSQASSPDNRQVNVTYAASGGRISGTGNTATLDTTGANNGAISITCTATDDRGLTASSNTSVNVEAPPPPPPPPTASKLNEIQFKNPAKPARVDNEAKAILDDVALRLQRDADAKAVVVGFVDPGEKGGQRLAQERAQNTKAYLVQEKQIDASRIELRTGTAGGKRAEIWLVPAGATFTGEGTQAASEKPAAPARRGGARTKKGAATKPAPTGGGQPR